MKDEIEIHEFTYRTYDALAASEGDQRKRDQLLDVRNTAATIIRERDHAVWLVLHKGRKAK